MKKIDQKGSCYCGSVQFRAKGNILYNCFCHCKACSYNRGMSPVHLIGISPPEGIEITKGEELLTLYRGKGRMYYCFCEKCGCGVYQGPEGLPYRTVFPTNFHIEDGVNCALPDKHLPEFHVNYENRQMDWHDPLPKYKTFPSGVAEGPGYGITMNNRGEEISA